MEIPSADGAGRANVVVVEGRVAARLSVRVDARPGAACIGGVVGACAHDEAESGRAHGSVGGGTGPTKCRPRARVLVNHQVQCML